MSSEKKKNFMRGAALLGAAGLIVKAIGAMYRIPMTNILGTEGMGIFQKAYPIYSTLLVLSTAGLPSAISKMVSEHLSHGDRKGAQRVFEVSLILLAAVGAVSAVVLFAARAFVANSVVQDPLVVHSLTAIAPSLFFVAVMSAFRGYFQGMQNMVPTALSQIVEQVGKLAVGIFLAVRMLPKGLEYGAAGALIGVTASEFAAMLYVIAHYMFTCRRWRAELRKENGPKEKMSRVLGRLLPVAIPIMLGACVMPLTTFVDSVLVTNRLEAIGYTVSQARSLYGNLTGAVNTLVNMPSVLSLALCMSLVPAIAEAKSMKDNALMVSRIRGGLKISMLVGLPCAAGLAILAPNIIHLLYSSYSPSEITVASNLLRLMFVGVIALGVVQTLNGVLQGMGKVFVPVFSLGCGAIVKIVLNYVLIGLPSVGVYGAAISTSACYTTAAVINIVVVSRQANIRFDFGDMLARPLTATGFMAVAAGAVLYIASIRFGSAVSTCLSIVAGVAAYVIAMPLTGAIAHEDFAMISAGARLERLLIKLRLMKRSA